MGELEELEEKIVARRDSWLEKEESDRKLQLDSGIDLEQQAYYSDIRAGEDNWLIFELRKIREARRSLPK